MFKTSLWTTGYFIEECVMFVGRGSLYIKERDVCWFGVVFDWLNIVIV